MPFRTNIFIIIFPSFIFVFVACVSELFYIRAHMYYNFIICYIYTHSLSYVQMKLVLTAFACIDCDTYRNIHSTHQPDTPYIIFTHRMVCFFIFTNIYLRIHRVMAGGRKKSQTNIYIGRWIWVLFIFLFLLVVLRAIWIANQTARFYGRFNAILRPQKGSDKKCW